MHELCFFHFSGFNYVAMLGGEIKHREFGAQRAPQELYRLCLTYAEMLKSSGFLQFIKLGYSYGRFSDGLPISNIHRRLYRRIYIEREESSCLDSPFNAEGWFRGILDRKGLTSAALANDDKTSITARNHPQWPLTLLRWMLKGFFILAGARNYFKIIRLLRCIAILENHTFLLFPGRSSRLELWT
jgi:hypothetical protein